MAVPLYETAKHTVMLKTSKREVAGTSSSSSWLIFSLLSCCDETVKLMLGNQQFLE